MSTIINALKQLDSQGVAFAPQSSPDSIDDRFEPAEAESLPDPDQAVAEGGDAESATADPLQLTAIIADSGDLCSAADADEGDEIGDEVQATESKTKALLEADPDPDLELHTAFDAELSETEQASGEPDNDDALTVMFENAFRELPPLPTVRIADLIDGAAPAEQLPPEDVPPEDVGATQPFPVDAESAPATCDAGVEHHDTPNRESPSSEGLYDIDGASGLDLSGDVVSANTPEADISEQSETATGLLSSDSNAPELNEPESSDETTHTEVDDSFTAQLVDLPPLTLPLEPGGKLEPSPQTERFEQVHPTEPYQPIESVDEGASIEPGEPAAAVEPVETVLVGNKQQANQVPPTTESGAAEGEDEQDEGGTQPEEEGRSESPHAGQSSLSDEGRGYEQSLLENLADETLAQQYSRTLHRMIAASPSGLPTVLMVLSSRHQPHVSETLAHLAMVLVQRDAGRVLLVDAGLPRKTLSRQFGIARRPGLADICRGDKGWQEVLVSGTDPRLCILPGGTGPTPPILGAGKVADMMKQWKEEAQIVLVDVGSVQAPLTEALTQAGDSVFLLVRLGQTQRKEAEAAVAKLRGLGGSLQGCIVTNAGASSTA